MPQMAKNKNKKKIKKIFFWLNVSSRNDYDQSENKKQ